MFLGSIKAPVPSSRPAIVLAGARRPCQIRRIAAGPGPRGAPSWGDDGEDPQFDRAEHDAMLAAKEGLFFPVVAGTAASGLAGEAFRIEDGELVHGLLPMVCGTSPAGGDIAQCQPDQLVRRVVGGKMSARLDDLTESGI